MHLRYSVRFSRPLAILPAVLLHLFSTVALCQLVPPAPTPSTRPATGPAPESLETRLAQARTDLATSMVDGKLVVPPGISADDALLRRATLERLVRLYENQKSENQALEAARQTHADLAREVQAWTGFEQPRPYSILLKDSIREQMHAAQQRITSAAEAQQALQQLIESTRVLLAQSEVALRKINESIEGAQTLAAKTVLIWQRDFEQVRSRMRAASIRSLDTSLQIERQQAEDARLRLGLLQRQWVIVSADAAFTRTDLGTIIARLDAQQQRLENELELAKQQIAQARTALDTAMSAVQSVRTSAQTPNSGQIPKTDLLDEAVALRRVQMETQGVVMAALRTELDIATAERALWSAGFAMATDANAQTLLQARLRLADLSRQVQLWKDYYQQRIDVANDLTDLQQARLNGMDGASELVPLVKQQLQSLQQRSNALQRVYRGTERLDQLLDRWDEELLDAAAALPLAERLSNLFSDASAFLGRLWDFELFTAEDTIIVDEQAITGKRSITVGKTIKVLLILIVGYWITGVLARFAERQAAKRFSIDPTHASLMRRWLRALLLTCLLIFSLVSVRIPLTAFAFGGGALAIALGFGTQTILKNLVSGVIILFERPFKVGDVLDIGTNRGVVTSIGLRASVVRLWDNTETLIPNSELLESRLTNWTYSNRNVRFTITVGVAYGSDTRLVTRLLGEIADRHSQVAQLPKPQVFFTSFGNSALDFELRFWVDVLKDNAAQISSDLRHMIAESFVEQGVVIAFPQRDVHFDVNRPLQVQMVTPPGPAGKV